MTREEAISNLNMISVAFVGPVTKEQRKLIDDTFGIAIQTLSQEPTTVIATGDGAYYKIKALQEPCEDAISRQDDRGVSLKSVKHALYDVCLHEDNMALFSKLLDRVNKARDWEEYQAIKQEPCTHPDKCHECEKILTCTYYKQEPCEDAISREAVIKTVDAHTNEDGTLDDDISVILEELPSFKPQEKTGHWVYDYTSADGHKTYHCSECGCYLQPKHSEPLNSFKWCSSCGVKMIEPQERSEE